MCSEKKKVQSSIVETPLCLYRFSKSPDKVTYIELFVILLFHATRIPPKTSWDKFVIKSSLYCIILRGYQAIKFLILSSRETQLDDRL